MRARPSWHLRLNKNRDDVTTFRGFPATARSCCSIGSISGLQALPHPMELSSVEYRSEGWTHAICRLYRTLYKLHAKQLHPIQREFGDRFVQTEFQRHIDASEKHARIFYQSWYSYAVQLLVGQTSRDMTAEEQQQLTPEQKETMRRLRSHVLQAKQSEPGFHL
ncbi:hypothetical protein, conserved [Trypanosoma brucei brucei TREU927]|uniref:Succinate dehydrogenase assembly factor 3 n=1 Tax=Trypanosoma brucei brucei (strain 927/4 GUTat10.1) TaxID=185431 RepID=Q386B2_TRYB2|nr:hypothetical protein, conserved [Trypanosoma brucei brucei TREU927]EAN79369.1 hypothetical protein, conserved [Trypanosoma brucei brucei TREU927]